jgi:L-ascorbate metabolism protein UlaG (beta-lactamase superfamily)
VAGRWVSTVDSNRKIFHDSYVTSKLPPNRPRDVALVPTVVHQSAAGRRLSCQPGLTVDVLRWSRRGRVGEELIWLGAAGFALLVDDRLVLVDPYLSDSLAAKYAGRLFPHVRLFPVPIEASDISGAEAVLHTHGHTDHLDPWTVAALVAGTHARFLAPRACADLAVERGIPADRLVGLGDRDIVEVAGVTVTALPAAHEELATDAHGNHVALGYVIDTGRTRIYHSGDCVPYPGLADRLRELRVDLALLPINGRDEYRARNGVPGNFTVREAVELCRDAGIPELLCHHFGLFDFNTVPTAVALAELSAVDDIGWTLPAVGAGFRIDQEVCR